MTRLIPMTEAEFVAYTQQAVIDYAADKVSSGAWTAQEALDKARGNFQTLLPQGTATPRHDLFVVVEEATGERVGALWYAVETRGGAEVAYVYDIHIDPSHQRQGHATRAFHALEEVVRVQGLSGIALHVFGHNSGAQAFYATLGYLPTDIMLFKPLGPKSAGDTKP